MWLRAVIILYFLFFPLAGDLAHSATKPIKADVGLVFDLTQRDGEALNVILGLRQAAIKLKESNLELNFKIYDSKSTPLGTRTAMQSVLKDAPHFIVAENNSSKAFVAAEMAEAARRFLITPMASSPSITESKRYIYRATFSDDFQGTKLAGFVYESLNQKKAAIIWDGGQLYSKTLTTAFKKAYEARGGKIVLQEEVSSTAEDYSSQLLKVSKSGAKAVFIPVYDSLAARLISQASRLDTGIRSFIGGDGWSPEQIFPKLVTAKHFLFSLYWVMLFHPNLQEPKVAAQLREMESRTQRVPDDSLAIGYDVGMLLGNLLKALGRAPRNQDEILKTLGTLPKWTGLTADFDYRRSHDAEKPLIIYTLSSGKSVFFKEIAP